MMVEFMAMENTVEKTSYNVRPGRNVRVISMRCLTAVQIG